MLGPLAPSSAVERSETDQARDAAARYAKMDGVEKCAFAGELIRRMWFARVYQPDAVEELERCKVCGAPKYTGLDPNAEMPRCFAEGRQCVSNRPVAREQQIPPWMRDPINWADVSTWILCGGRGSGKSRSGNGYTMPEMLLRPETRTAYLGPDFKVSVGVMITGKSGLKTLLEQFDPSLIYKWNEVKNVLTLVNGSIVNCLSSKEPGSIEGPEYHISWCDELAELLGQGGDNCVWRKRLEPGVRLVGPNGEPPKHLMSGTPEATLLWKDMHDSFEQYPTDYQWQTLATRDNIANLDRKKTQRLYREAEGTSFAQQKLEGHLILESPHALLSEEDLVRVRLVPGSPEWVTPEMCEEVVVVVDANHSDNKKSDECGIVVMGLYRGKVYTFADASIGGGPKAWGERIIEVLKVFPEIDKIVVEDDKSLVLDVVEKVLKESLEDIGRPIKVEPIYHNNKSKKERADPVAVLVQVKRILFAFCPRVGDWNFTLLDWQWKSWNPKDPKAKSPDRVDAHVYGGTYFLLVGRQSDSFFVPGAG